MKRSQLYVEKIFKSTVLCAINIKKTYISSFFRKGRGKKHFVAVLVHEKNPLDGNHIRLQYMFPDCDRPVCATRLSEAQKNIIGAKTLRSHEIERNMRNLFYGEGVEIGIGTLNRRSEIVPRTRRYIQGPSSSRRPRPLTPCGAMVAREQGFLPSSACPDL